MNLPRITATVLAVFGLFAASVWATDDPIPGVDVVVRKKPGGHSIEATTDKSGTFTFSGLAAGKYELSLNLRQQKAAINTSRSNIRHPNLRVVNGAEVATFQVTLGDGVPAPVEITFTKNGAKITGTVTGDTSASPAKPGPAKPAADGAK